MHLRTLAESIIARPGPVRLVAIDGPGGAGTSTFAALHAAVVVDGTIPVVDGEFATVDPTR